MAKFLIAITRGATPTLGNLWVATSTGLWNRALAGSWSHVLDDVAQVISPRGTPSVVYASALNPNGLFSGASVLLRVSIDGGLTWSDLTSFLPDALGTWVSVADGDGAHLFLSSQAGVLWESTDSGLTWTSYDSSDAAPTLPPANDITDGAIAWAQGHASSGIPGDSPDSFDQPFGTMADAQNSATYQSVRTGRGTSLSYFWNAGSDNAIIWGGIIPPDHWASGVLVADSVGPSALWLDDDAIFNAFFNPLASSGTAICQWVEPLDATHFLIAYVDGDVTFAGYDRVRLYLAELTGTDMGYATASYTEVLDVFPSFVFHFPVSGKVLDVAPLDPLLPLAPPLVYYAPFAGDILYVSSDSGASWSGVAVAVWDSGTQLYSICAAG